MRVRCTVHTRASLRYLQKQFRPVYAGVQVIPPVLVKATLPTQVDARGRALSTEKFVASSPSLTVAIRPVPTTGQPASFRGAVGRFHLEGEAHPTVLRVGDPLSLTLTLRGEGLWDTVHPPALEQQLGQDFKVQADPPAVKTENDAKAFTSTLRPRHARIREIPPVEVAYFDPDTQRFQVLRSSSSSGPTNCAYRRSGASPWQHISWYGVARARICSGVVLHCSGDWRGQPFSASS